MSKTRKISILSMVAVFCLSVCFGLCGMNFTAKADAVDNTVGQFDFYLDAGELACADIRQTTEVKDGLFILQGTGTSALSIDKNPKTAKDIIDGEVYYPFAQRIKTNGKSDLVTMERTISFFLDKQATIKVYALSSSSGDSSRRLALFKNGNSTPIAEPTVKGSDNILAPLVYTTTEAGSYYFAALDNGVNIYFIGVTYTGEAAPVVRGPWSEVVEPTLGATTISEDKTTVTVPYVGNIGLDGADKISVYMYKESDPTTPVQKRTALPYGTSGSVEFQPTDSGRYTFKAESIRLGETSKFSAMSTAIDYILPFAAPSVRARTGEESKLMISVTEVKEADGYKLKYRKVQEPAIDFTEVPLTATGTGEIAYELAGFAVGDSVEIQATASRSVTSENRDSTLITAKVRGQVERDWEFRRFGTSTKDELNFMVEGGNIFDGLTLNSATFDTTKRAIGKGGKYTYGGFDGISFYFTKIKAAEEDFRIKAMVTVNYLNPTIDGQEGFALLVRDAIGLHGDTTQNYSNSAAAIATKIQFKNGASNTTYSDGLGSRFVTGIESLVETPKEVKQVMKPLLEGTIYETGEFIIELEKINNCYYTRYYEMNYSTGVETMMKENVLYHDENDKDQLLVIDKDYVYAGFSVARGCNATFTNIEFETKPRSTDYIEIQKEKVLGDYSITSPTTSSVPEYNFSFLSNADGVLNMKLNGADFIKDQAITNYADFTAPATLVLGENNFEGTFTPNADFFPSQYEVMASYETVVVQKIVYVQSFFDAATPIYVAPHHAPDKNGIIGSPSNKGTKASPLDLQTAINYCQVGQTIFLMEGTYEITSGNITVERGNNGTAEAFKVLRADPAAKTRPVLDYKEKGGGLTVWGDYWHLDGFDVTRTAFGKKAIQLGGKNNILENVNAYYNGDSGISISGKSTDAKSKWPVNNLVLNCTAYMNKDQAQEDADGFAAKLYCKEGNVFRGCIAYCNADDGWDLYAKTETGSIGAVTIEDCVAFGNGFNIDGEPTYGNGNGFKMGGESLPAKHKITNSIAFGNKKKGVDSNSCPDIIVENCTSVYNGTENYSLYSTKLTSFQVSNCLSFVCGGSDGVPTQDVNPVINENNYLTYTVEGISKTNNSAGVVLNPADLFEGWTDNRKSYFGFILTNSAIIDGNFNKVIDKITVRNADDSINLNGFLVLKDDNMTSGARLSPIAGKDWGDKVTTTSGGCKSGCKSQIGFVDCAIGFVLLAGVMFVLLKKQKVNA